MSRSVTHLRLFLAAPADVSDEREAVREVVKRVNLQIGERVGLAIDIVEWPTNMVPGISTEPQDVINRQIGKCEIFIILFWKRLGTPTAAHLSGTIEEFERGYDAWKNDPKTQIFVYFSRRPFSPALEDMPQLTRLLEFKRELSARGVLYYTFETTHEFETKLHDHLALFLFQWADILKTDDEKMLTFELKDSRRCHVALRELLENSRHVGVIYCDLDHFTDLKNALRDRTRDQKKALDRSNELLAHLATTIVTVVGHDGFVFRYAGDEFVALVPNRRESQVVDLAEQIRLEIADEGHFEGLDITTSIGIACTQSSERDHMVLIMRASDATYVAKLTGKNRVVKSPISTADEDLIKIARDSGNS